MKGYILKDTTWTTFVALEKIVIDYCISNNFIAGPTFAGGGDKTHRKEAWSFQFVDISGNEVLKYEYDNTTQIGTYNGKLTINLSSSQEKILEKNISSLIKNLLVDQKEHQFPISNP